MFIKIFKQLLSRIILLSAVFVAGMGFFMEKIQMVPEQSLQPI